MSRGAQTFKVKPKLICQHTADRISGAEAEAVLGFTVDKRRAFWQRGETVYVYPWALIWAGFHLRRYLVSYGEQVWVAHAVGRLA